METLHLVWLEIAKNPIQSTCLGIFFIFLTVLCFGGGEGGEGNTSNEGTYCD